MQIFAFPFGFYLRTSVHIVKWVKPKPYSIPWVNLPLSRSMGPIIYEMWTGNNTGKLTRYIHNLHKCNVTYSNKLFQFYVIKIDYQIHLDYANSLIDVIIKNWELGEKLITNSHLFIQILIVSADESISRSSLFIY